MKLYLCDAQGVLLGETEARVSPARPQNPDGSPNYLFPAGSTATPPPATGDGQAAVFDGQTWRVEEDYRGQTAYATADGSALAIRAVGPVPEGYTRTPPPGRAYTWDAASASWQPDMAAIRAAAEDAIDAQADALLAPYMSLTPGRAMTYLAKEEQARQFLAEENPDPAAYPLIAGEVGITADTEQAVAETILAMSQAWHAMGAAIESARLAAKKKVRETATPEAVQAVCDAIVWPKAEATA